MRRRRIRVRAWRRGLREMDILMGRFVDARVEALPAEALDELESLLDLPDEAVFRWLSGAEPAPAEHDSPLLRQIIAFHRHDGPIH
ncbi:MAG: succinate dehydrogenase assembly factor 2 [Alphaproteobacteria bacterium]|nr:succinate dehydrogenase assembly factor 2 [Alphaproteobacteria bacterium]MBM3642558.1 succinate dehydrogenase assembly factor 2 [Alphaproteobacteria bacterium]